MPGYWITFYFLVLMVLMVLVLMVGHITHLEIIIRISDTLTLITGRNISKYQFLREGEFLMLNFISLEQRDERYFPVRLEGNWKYKY